MCKYCRLKTIVDRFVGRLEARMVHALYFFSSLDLGATPAPSKRHLKKKNIKQNHRFQNHEDRLSGSF